MAGRIAAARDEISRKTLERYRAGSKGFWAGTRQFALGAGFEEVRHDYRPTGLPQAEESWLASLARNPEAS